jgi:LacI family transcriptional regulator
VGKLRITGYRNALKNQDDFYIANSSKPDSLREKTQKLLVEDKVEAILCTDFVSTMMVYRLAYENKISIPKDLKVIGFLNADVARFLTPSISYVEQFPEEIGEQAVDLLVNRIENRIAGKQPINKTINTKLIHLESTDF